MCYLVVLVVGPGSRWASQPFNFLLSPPGGLSSTAQTNLPNVVDSKEQVQFSCSSKLGSNLPALTPLESTLLFGTGEVQGLFSIYLVRSRTSFSVLKLRGMRSCLSKVARGEGDSKFSLLLPCYGTPESSPAFKSTDLAQLFSPLTGSALVCCPGERRGAIFALPRAAAGEGQGQFSHFLKPALSPARFQGMTGGKETFPYPCHHLADGSLISPPALTVYNLMRPH